VGNVVSQGDSDNIGCRILVYGVFEAVRFSHEVNAFACCVLKVT
jgi:hypothetical protein